MWRLQNLTRGSPNDKAHEGHNTTKERQQGEADHGLGDSDSSKQELVPSTEGWGAGEVVGILPTNHIAEGCEGRRAIGVPDALKRLHGQERQSLGSTSQNQSYGSDHLKGCSNRLSARALRQQQ